MEHMQVLSLEAVRAEQGEVRVKAAKKTLWTRKPKRQQQPSAVRPIPEQHTAKEAATEQTPIEQLVAEQSAAAQPITEITAERTPKRRGWKSLLTLDFALKCCFVLFFALALFTAINVLGSSDVFKRAAEETSAATAGAYSFFTDPFIV